MKIRLCLQAAVLLIPLFGLLAAGGPGKPPELGLQAYTFRNLSLCETLEKARAAGIHYLEAYPGQILGGGLPGKFSHTMDEPTRLAILQKAKDCDVTIAGYGVVNAKDEAGWRQIFDFAKAMRLRWVNCEPPQDVLPLLASLSEESGIKVALHNHPAPARYSDPAVALQAAAAHPARIGICADTGHWVRSGFDPVATLKQCEGKIILLHMKDLNQRGSKAYDVPWGTGTSDIAGQVMELRRQGFDGIAVMEYEHATPKLEEEVSRSAAFFREIAKADATQAIAPVPPGFTANPDQIWSAGRGADSKRWPAPSPLFLPDLSNAEFKPGSWVMEDGVLAAKGGGDIWTRDSYGDFSLSLDFRCAENTNSGVFLRCSDIVNWLNNAIEVQILQGDATDQKHVCGAVFDCLAPSRQLPIHPGEWNTFVITAKGEKITVSLNREQIINMNLDAWNEPHKNPDGSPNKFEKAYKDMPREGRIGLQYHGFPIEFRNIQIERL